MSLADDLTRAMQGIFNGTAAPAALPDIASMFSPSPQDEPDDESPEAIACPQAMSVPDEPAAPASAPERSLRHPYGRRSGRRRFQSNANWRTVEAIEAEINPRTGNIEIRFPGKPVVAVRDQLKSRGWRWSGTDGCWYHSNSTANLDFAKTMAGR